MMSCSAVRTCHIREANLEGGGGYLEGGGDAILDDAHDQFVGHEPAGRHHQRLTPQRVTSAGRLSLTPQRVAGGGEHTYPDVQQQIQFGCTESPAVGSGLCLPTRYGRRALREIASRGLSVASLRDP